MKKRDTVIFKDPSLTDIIEEGGEDSINLLEISRLIHDILFVATLN